MSTLNRIQAGTDKKKQERKDEGLSDLPLESVKIHIAHKQQQTPLFVSNIKNKREHLMAKHKWKTIS